MFPIKGSGQAHSLLTTRELGAQIHRPPKALMFFQWRAASCAIDYRSASGDLHLTAEGIVGIAAALLIVIVVVAASRL